MTVEYGAIADFYEHGDISFEYISRNVQTMLNFFECILQNVQMPIMIPNRFFIVSGHSPLSNTWSFWSGAGKKIRYPHLNQRSYFQFGHNSIKSSQLRIFPCQIAILSQYSANIYLFYHLSWIQWRCLTTTLTLRQIISSWISWVIQADYPSSHYFFESIRKNAKCCGCVPRGKWRWCNRWR
jgi:hypothetical protein